VKETARAATVAVVNLAVSTSTITLVVL